MGIREIITIVLLLLGLFCFIASTIGAFRMKDFYSKLHAAGICGSSGLVFCGLGLMIYEGLNLTSVKLFLVFLFVFLTSPIGTHIITKVGYKSSSNKVEGKEAS
mgnify:FL=1